MKFLSKSFIIVLFMLLLVGVAVVLEMSLKLEAKKAELSAGGSGDQPSIPYEKGVFTETERALAFSAMDLQSEDGRDLEHYYDNRAYHGAPPTIPHAISTDNTIGAQSCLKCHEKGGYVSKFEAFAPVTPHPQLVSCVQCHVPVNSEDMFTESGFNGKGKPDLQQRALLSSPPIIPHKIHMHENCLSCHAGPSAPKAIRTTHPERTNCLQCHAKGEKAIEFGEWDRKALR